MSQFSTRNPYQMGKEAYADGLGPTDTPAAFTVEEQHEFRRGWIAAQDAALYRHTKNEFFRRLYGGSANELV
jgi:hypothetical protein